MGRWPEEVAPLRKGKASEKDKRGISCEEIDFTFKVIRVAEAVSKTPFPRNVRVSEAALAWLE
jgi:hypothetical protein